MIEALQLVFNNFFLKNTCSDKSKNIIGHLHQRFSDIKLTAIVLGKFYFFANVANQISCQILSVLFLLNSL